MSGWFPEQSVAGIDIDVQAVHVVWLDEDSDRAVYRAYRLDLGPGNYHAKARRVPAAVPRRSAWRDRGVVCIGIEEPMTPPKVGFRSAVPQAVIRGALLAALPRDEDVPVVLVRPAEWKKWSLGGGFPGKGNAGKPEVEVWARRAWVDCPPGVSQDALDAFCVAWALRALRRDNAGREAA